jgi:tRNA nucleotidyltransferase (CCA-adding enzyme)
MTSAFKIPKKVSHVTETLKKAQFEAYLVGGCVRDLFLGRMPKDWDVTTNAKPEEIISLFPKTFYENEYGTVGVVNESVEDKTLEIIEVTPYRTEGKYTDKRRPDSVSFDATLEDDLKRRDFTINAIALDIEKNVVVDPFLGRKDIQSGIIKTVGEASERFEEDGLRIMRAIRIQAELGFEIEENTKNAIQDKANLLGHIAKERIRDELARIIMSDKPMVAIEALREARLLEHVAPELENGIGVKQTKTHAYDVWTHLLKSLQHAADKGFPLHIRLAALFHDISKPETRRWSEEKGEWTFYGHEVVGEKVTKNILKNLKFSSEIIEKVTKLVRWHMFFSDTEQITHSAVRRMVANVGKDLVWDLMNVRVCDRIGTGRPKENPYRLRKYKSMVEEVLEDPVSVGMLKIDGSRIMEITKLPPSPKIGHILHALLEEVLENPSLNSEDLLENRAIELSKLDDESLTKLGMEGIEVKESAEDKRVTEIRKKHWVE